MYQNTLYPGKGTTQKIAIARSLSNSDLTSAAADNATSTITFAGGDPVALGLAVGDVLQFANMSEVANNSTNFLITGFGGTSNRQMTVSPAPTTQGADSSFTLTVNSKTHANAVGTQTRYVRAVLVDATDEAYICVGKITSSLSTTAKADGNEMPILPGQVEYFDIRPGENVSAFGTNGNLCITEVTK